MQLVSWRSKGPSVNSCFHVFSNRVVSRSIWRESRKKTEPGYCRTARVSLPCSRCFGVKSVDVGRKACKEPETLYTASAQQLCVLHRFARVQHVLQSRFRCYLIDCCSCPSKAARMGFRASGALFATAATVQLTLCGRELCSNCYASSSLQFFTQCLSRRNMVSCLLLLSDKLCVNPCGPLSVPLPVDLAGHLARLSILGFELAIKKPPSLRSSPATAILHTANMASKIGSYLMENIPRLPTREEKEMNKSADSVFAAIRSMSALQHLIFFVCHSLSLYLSLLTCPTVRSAVLGTSDHQRSLHTSKNTCYDLR